MVFICAYPLYKGILLIVPIKRAVVVCVVRRNTQSKSSPEHRWQQEQLTETGAHWRPQAPDPRPQTVPTVPRGYLLRRETCWSCELSAAMLLHTWVSFLPVLWGVVVAGPSSRLLVHRCWMGIWHQLKALSGSTTTYLSMGNRFASVGDCRFPRCLFTSHIWTFDKTRTFRAFWLQKQSSPVKVLSSLFRS